MTEQLTHTHTHTCTLIEWLQHMNKWNEWYPWIWARQALLFMEFSRQEYWSGRSLLQGIFATQGSNLHLLHGRQISYWLSHQRSQITQYIIAVMTLNSYFLNKLRVRKQKILFYLHSFSNTLHLDRSEFLTYITLFFGKCLLYFLKGRSFVERLPLFFFFF